MVIGMGATETTTSFKEHHRLPFTVLVDKKRESYRILGLERGSMGDVMGPKVWRAGARSILRYGQGVPKEDPYQLGGAAVVRDGTVVLLHRSETSADNLSVDDLLAAI